MTLDSWIPGLTLLYMGDTLSSLGAATYPHQRSKWFWLAWWIQEQGWTNWTGNFQTNNPYNISGPISDKPWFLGNVGVIRSNNVVLYRDQLCGIWATYRFISEAFSDVLRAETDELACQALDKPGRYGRWCPDPEYGYKIYALLQQISPKE